MIVVSRSCGKKPGFELPNESLLPSVSSAGKGAFSGSRLVVVIDVEAREEARLLVMIVRESRGMLSFFVKRMEAEAAVRADRRARWRGARGMRRLIVLFSTADWMV